MYNDYVMHYKTLVHRYTIDETSPENTIEETFDYYIMSKANKVKSLQRTSLWDSSEQNDMTI